ncbi:MAG: hypothetical protein LBS99_01865 [Clostridiales bacterium]|jgi:hypothetical protein|nr:hypothetical protein [Clostridiales bacterium]
MEIFYKGANPYFLGALILITFLQFALMSPRFDLRLSVFFIESVGLTAVMLPLTAIFTTVWGIASCVVCALYALGAGIHLANGKRTVKEVVTGPKGRHRH